MQHLQILLSLLSIIGYGISIDEKYKFKPALSLIYAAIGIGVLLYFSALTGFLEPTVVVLRYIGIGCFGYYLIFRNKGLIYFFRSLFYFIFSLVSFYIISCSESYITFSFIDDYSHWGRMTKLITENNRLIQASDPIGVRDYPPITSLLHYFFTYFSGYTERITIFANAVVVFLMINFAVEKSLNTSSKIISGMFILATYSLIWIFGEGFHCLWADLILGISFGISILVYSLNKKVDKLNALLSCFPILVMMILIKQIGILFAFFVLAIIATDYLSEKKQLFKKYLIFLFCILLLIFVNQTWKIYLEYQHIDRVFTANITFIDLNNAFNPHTATERQSLTISRFVDYVFLSHHLTTYWFFISVLSVMAIRKLSSTNANPFEYSIHINLFLTYFVYLFVLLILYMVSFSEWEGVRLASISRYILTFSLGMSIFYLGLLSHLIKPVFNQSIGNKLLISLVFLYIFPNLGRILNDLSNINSFEHTNKEIQKIRHIATISKDIVSNDSKVYFIWSNGSNDESVIFNYFMLPTTSNLNCSYIEPENIKSSPEKPWICKINQEEFIEKIRYYDYLILANPSDAFVEYFLAKYNINNFNRQSVYSISWSNGELHLDPKR